MRDTNPGVHTVAGIANALERDAGRLHRGIPSHEAGWSSLKEASMRSAFPCLLAALLCSAKLFAAGDPALLPQTVTDDRWAALEAVLQEAKLTASGVQEADAFGQSISLDGDRALVGAWADAANAGVVYVFDFQGGGWVQSARFTASSVDPGDAFGISVSLDGDRALIGAYGDDQGGSGAGAAYLFEFDGTDWIESAKLVASDAASNRWFGNTVSLDGGRALVGAPREASNTGAVYVFDLDGVDWNETARLIASDAAPEAYFGGSLSLQGDRALVGAYGDAAFAGAAYVFDAEGGQWSEAQKLTAGDADGFDLFGASLSLDGDRALIGASGDDAAGGSAGAAYVFAFDGIAWSEASKIIASNAGPLEYFGQSVSLDGDRALVGAVGGDNFTGAAHVFEYAGNAWVERQTLVMAGAAEDDWFGRTVSLDGDRAIVVALSNRGGDVYTGSAHVFEFGGADWRESAQLVSSVASPGDSFGDSSSIDGDRALVGAPGEDSGRGVVYVFEWRNRRWVQAATLRPSQPSGVEQFGWSVSLDGDRALVGTLKDDGLAHIGTAYVFDFNGAGWVESGRLETSDFTEGFGYSVSLDGDRALVGANADSNAGIDSGSVYVFERHGGDWIEAGEFFASDPSLGAWFGRSVSLDGDRALVGAPFADDDEGAAYVFEYDGGGWIEAQKISASDAAQDESFAGFGATVVLDGDRAVVGAYARDQYTGAAYVFERDAGTWTETRKLTASDGAPNDFFGTSISLSGSRILVGAWRDTDGGLQAGAAYLYDFDGVAWTEIRKLSASDRAEGDRFGDSVSMQGGRMLIGARGADDSTGAVYAYDLDSVFHDSFE